MVKRPFHDKNYTLLLETTQLSKFLCDTFATEFPLPFVAKTNEQPLVHY